MFNPDFYPTPPDVAATMLDPIDLRGRVVVEPSAGSGTVIEKSVSKLLAAADPGLFRMMLRWQGILIRCYDKRNVCYPLYGGRGIYVCDAWHNFQAFFDFWGLPPCPNSSMERIDNDDGYTPLNCKWALAGEQNMNTRRNKWIEYNGQTKTVTQWAEFYDVNPSRLSERLRRGWSFEKAVQTPCPRGYQKGRQMHIESSRASWQENGSRYSRNSRLRRQAGLYLEDGLLIESRNYHNLI